MESLLDCSNNQKLNEYMSEQWSKNDKRILVALLKKGATLRNVYQLRDLLCITSGAGIGRVRASDSCYFAGAYPGWSIGASDGAGGDACAVLFVCFLCVGCFAMIAKTADLFYNSIKDDYAFVKLTKVFLLAVSTMGLYMTSQDYLIEEIDPNTDSSRSGSSSTMLLNNAIVLPSSHNVHGDE